MTVYLVKGAEKMTKEIMPRLIYPVNDGYVSNLKPVIQGTGEPEATVNGNIDAQPFSVIVSSNGVWSYNLQNELADLTEHTVSFTQVSTNGQKSPLSTVKFRTDTKLLYPHTIQYPQNNQVINTNLPVISGTGKAGAIIEMNLCETVYHTVVNPGGSWQIKTETLPEGPAFIYVIQKDVGNISPAICASFTVDTVAPVEPVIEFPNDSSFINCPMPVFSGNGEPNASIDAIVDERKYSAVVNAQGKWSFEAGEALMDDSHILSARQIDMAGNISPEAISIFTVKTVQPGPPVISNPASGSILSVAQPVLAGRGETGCVVVTRVYDQIYSALVGQDGTWELKTSEKLLDGIHSLKIYQVDIAGNISPSIDLVLQVDTTIPPEPVIIYPEKGKFVNSSDFVIRGTGEPDAVVSCNVAGVEYTAKVATDGSWSVDVRGNENIKYKINYIIIAKQTDLAGNTGRINKTEFFVDKESLKAPQITYPKENESINVVSPSIAGTGKAGAVVNLNINNKNYSTKVLSNNSWAIAVADKLPQGENKMVVTQTECGNVSPTATVSFNVKLATPPCPVIFSPTNGELIENQAVIFKGNGEANAKINIRLDDACYSTSVNQFGGWEYTVSGLLPGIHCVMITQADLAGNESLCAHVNFATKIQQPLPVYPSGPISYQIIYNPPGPALTTKTIATLKTSSPITINNVNGNEFSMIISKNGLYEFKYTAQGGLVCKMTAGVTWIDCQAPVITVDSCGANAFSSDKIISYYKYGGSCINHALINDVPFESGKKVCEEGAYKIELTDTAGNLSTKDFIIDRTSPEIIGIEDQMTYKNDVSINFSDKLSGIQSAALNGATILPGSVVSENGNYTLVVTDFAGNTATKSFSIQKG